MNKRRFIDFDAMFKEKERQPILAKIKGQEFLFPAQMPAVVMLKIQRMEESGVDSSAEVSYEQTVTLYTDLIGVDNFQKLLDLGVSVNELNDVLEGVMSAYMEDIAGVTKQEAKKPEAADETEQTATTSKKVAELRL